MGNELYLVNTESDGNRRNIREERAYVVKEAKVLRGLQSQEVGKRYHIGDSKYKICKCTQVLQVLVQGTFQGSIVGAQCPGTHL